MIAGPAVCVRGQSLQPHPEHHGSSGREAVVDGAWGEVATPYRCQPELTRDLQAMRYVEAAQGSVRGRVLLLGETPRLCSVARGDRTGSASRPSRRARTRGKSALDSAASTYGYPWKSDQPLEGARPPEHSGGSGTEHERLASPSPSHGAEGCGCSAFE